MTETEKEVLLEEEELNKEPEKENDVEECEDDAEEDDDDDDDDDEEEEDESEASQDFDEDNANVQDIEVSDDENEILPVLLNGTKSRPKTTQNYVAPQHLRSRTVRSQDFPLGIWIDAAGHLQPDDPRSGIFRVGKKQTGKKRARETTSEDDEYQQSEEEEAESSEDDAESTSECEIDVEHLREKMARKRERNESCEYTVLSDNSILNSKGLLLNGAEKRELMLKDLQRASKL